MYLPTPTVVSMINHGIPTYLVTAARTDRSALLGSAVLSVLGAAAALAGPWPLALAVDYAIEGRRLPGWLAIAPPLAILVAAGLASLLINATVAGLDLAATRLAERTAERVGARLRTALFEHAIRLPLAWHGRIRSGELLSRLTTDVGRVLDALVAITATLLPEGLTLVGVLAVLLVIDPQLALLGLAVIPILAALSIQQRRRVRASQQQARTAAGALASTIADLLRNTTAVQAFNRTDWAVRRFRNRNDHTLDAETNAIAVETRWSPAARLVLSIGTAVVLVAGGWQVIQGRQSIGQLLVVLNYLAALYAPVRALTRLAASQAKAGASARRIAEVFDTNVPDEHGLPAAPVLDGPISIQGVSFGYDPKRPVLQNLSLDIAAGETVCLFGPSGAGKSTVLQLLLRLHEPQQGTIRVGGVDLRSYRAASVREQIAYVPQDPWLFDATLAQNVAFGSRTATRARLLLACHEAGVDEFVQRLPYGYDTPIGEGGSRLSGGQRRRVALARAAVSDAALVLLDEPTASLDAVAAGRVIAAVQQTSRRRTTVIVTHDPELAAIADRVIPIEPLPDPRTTPTDPVDVNATVSGRR